MSTSCGHTCCDRTDTGPHLHLYLPDVCPDCVRRGVAGVVIFAAVVVAFIGAMFAAAITVDRHQCNVLGEQLGVATDHRVLGGGCYVRQGAELWIPESWLNYGPTK